MPASRARRSADAALRKLYASLPSIECKGLCHHSCGPIGMSRLEVIHMEEANGGPLPWHMPSDAVVQAITCPLLAADKRCSIYGSRPLICRAWGVVNDPRMRCPHGCQTSRLLTPEESAAMFAKAEEISRRFEEESHGNVRRT